MKKKTSQAFTIVELLIVVTIIASLAYIAIIRYGPVAEQARAAEAWSTLAQIVTSENAFRVENNVYTSNWADLDRFDAAPLSDNFNFSVPNIDVNAGYAQAARISTTGGRMSYGMCLRNGRRGVPCNADVCNPGCP
jgi:prepilin-type N-terminal cleavage/methylation domain-containing protein